MKVLLINPPYTIPNSFGKQVQMPLGLAYLGAVLLKDGHTVKILDALVEGYDEEVILENNRFRYGLSFNKIKNIISNFNPDVVGVSCLFSTQIQNSLKVLAVAKGVNQKIKTVIGGAHASALPDITLKDKNVDYIIIGEGEYSFANLVRALGEGHYKDISKIDGLAFRKNNKIKINPKTTYIENLDVLPFPARDLLSVSKYFDINFPGSIAPKHRRNAPVITSRGCPAQCIFCPIHNVWGKGYRARSPENVVAELKHLIDEYGIKEIEFVDPNLTFDKVRANKLFDLMIKEKLNLEWVTNNGVALWALDKMLLTRMRKAGCRHIAFGVESGDPYILHHVIKKPLNLNKIKPLIDHAKKLGMETELFFVVGFPGETKENVKKTFKFAEYLNAHDAGFFIASPQPGTELLKICQEKGLIKKDIDYSGLHTKERTIITPAFKEYELERMIAKEFIKLKLRTLKNPRIFYRRVLLRLIKRPGYSTSYFFKHIIPPFFKKIHA